MLNVYFDLQVGYEKGLPVIEQMAEDYPAAVTLAKKWVREERLKDAKSIEEVFEMMVREV
ncbi:hypothetical protein [Fredinandcohnia sp. 179-A 10B2 NHS]|uniref:hypothetical protein n=1 Tax=Fredinandcohnia sp. 179-A 10B2 NHS TaxID=3235176 RepID=UPI0039A0A2B3